MCKDSKHRAIKQENRVFLLNYPMQNLSETEQMCNFAAGMKRTIKIFLISLAAVVVVAGAAGALGWYYVLSPLVKSSEDRTFQIRPDDGTEVVVEKVKEAAQCDVRGLQWLTRRSSAFRAGNYSIRPGDSMRDIWRRLLSGNQTPVRIVVPSARTFGPVASALGNRLMADSTDFAAVLTRPEQMARIIPNTYEVWWTLSPDEFLQRMEKEYARYWNDERKKKAESVGLTPDEVAILASIVDEETAKGDEKPIVAGLYLNRLRKGMMLQADPTVKYAVGDPTLRRILFEHLKVDSPYNTYLHTGLPPTPIRIPSVQALEAVINPARHEYIYMCAREDFSGYHNFAKTLSEHNANARRYQAALNARGIKN